MTTLVALSIYIPRLFIEPGYNFLYATKDRYSTNQQHYSVYDNKLFVNTFRPTKSDNKGEFSQAESRLYIHDVAKNENREIILAEAQSLQLDSNTVSPDNFEIVYGGRDAGLFPLLFWSERDYNSRYIMGHNVSKKLNLKLNQTSYYNSLYIIGWIIPNDKQ